MAFTMVNDNNIEDINEFLKDKKYENWGLIYQEINSIVDILKNINEGKETLDDYYNVEINDVCDENIEIVRKVIALKREAKGKDLNSKEIREAVKETIDIIDYLQR